MRSDFRTTNVSVSAYLILIFLLISVLTACTDELNTQVNDQQSCDAMASWFPHSSTPRPNDATFPGNSNCSFHQWSWQMFLWLTQEVNGEPRFLSFASPRSLLNLEEADASPLTRKPAGAVSLDEYLQAGTDGILVDQNGRSIYYSQYLNPVFVDFINSNSLTNPETVRSMDPATTFPIQDNRGAMELKVSWSVVQEDDDVSNKFTTSAEIAKLVNRDGNIVIDYSQTEQIELALIGFHIGGIVNNHPEMIWATFEHMDNAPNVPPELGLGSPVSDQDFKFYKANTTLENCNINPASSNRLRLDESTQTLTPITEVCRLYEFGNQSGVDPTNDANIASLNRQIQGQLTQNNDVWANYREIGAIWFLDGSNLQPGLSLTTDQLLTGSVSLSNSTIETFTQRQSTMNNCFRCHNTTQEFPPETGRDLDPLPATNLNISHAFKNIYFWAQEQ